jgi:competence protein ComEC
VREWLASDGDARAVDDASLGEGVRCDPVGCIAHLPDGRLVALSRSLDALAEDCERAAVIVSPRDTPPGCASARVIDRMVWRQAGAVALYRDGHGFVARPSRPPGYDRPWSPAYVARGPIVRPGLRAPASGPDATPRSEDLAPDD